VANSPGKVLANGMADVEHYLRAEGLTDDEIGQSFDLAAESGSYVIVGNRPDALFFEYGDYRIEEGGAYLDDDGGYDGY
jgi:hypothetical protein